MVDFNNLNQIIEWIEGHDKTVDLIKWTLLIIVAWASGFFKYFLRKIKNAELYVDDLASRCFLEELGETDEGAKRIRAIFLLHVGINNPTTDPIVVREFAMRFRTHRRLKKWTMRLHPATLPSRPRISVGDTTKLLRNWFSNFSEGPPSLTVSSRIESRNYESGYMLFVTSTYGYINPLVLSEHVHVEVSAKLTTGETLRSTSKIMRMPDRENFDAMVPGVVAYASNSSTWNISREQA